ncbi:uncharacterized protein LOC133317475 [Gastrolobium bilobum]|uniref:uncharacterized protein LOC133317475 n=1 Tax=Gastrolobium bilobum TaxID=150636 RepID=UPI002AB15326|nr:uncharacterized protein LOC133317475 [Gastrolobium bilobum]
MAEEGQRVSLNVYDLSQGLARQISRSFLGKAIEGIWHTGIVVYGNEYYFGGGIQIQHCRAGSTPYGTPLRVVDLGVTHVPKDVFEMYLQEISPRYTAESYSLLTHNCNNFTNEVAQFLVGATIPEYILQLPNEVTSSPIGTLLSPMLEMFETTLKSGGVPLMPHIITLMPHIIRPSTVSPLCSASVKPRNNSSAPKTEMYNSASHNEARVDPLANARSLVQDEISREFFSILASGTMRASEAAVLATKRIMEKFGQTDVSQS